MLIKDVSDGAEFVARFLEILELYRIGTVGLKKEESFSRFLEECAQVLAPNQELPKAR